MSSDKFPENAQNKKEESITPLQAQAVELIAQGKRASEVAEELEISRRTVYNYLKRPDCAKYLIKLVTAHGDAAKRAASFHSRTVVDRMLRILEGKPIKTRDGKRIYPSHKDMIRAAQVIVKLGGLAETKLNISGEVAHTGEIELELKNLTDEQLRERAKRAGDRVNRIRRLIEGAPGGN